MPWLRTGPAPHLCAHVRARPQALPIILIEVIGPELFGEGGGELGVTYIGLYLIVYLVLQVTAT